MSGAARRTVTVLLSCVAVFGLLYIACINHVEPGEAGIAWNFVTGDLWLQESGYHLTVPWTLVAVVDTRPQRVCITSGSHAAFNCRLVQFQTDSWREFVRTEGWRYYWLANRFSLNLGYREEYRGFRDILRGYTFSAQKYPFVRVLQEYPE